MKNYLLIVFGLFFGSIHGYCQYFQGKAVYESKTQVNMNFEGRRIPEDRKKEIMARIKKANEKTFVLHFNRTESIYKESEKLEQPTGRGGGGGGRRRFPVMGAAGGDVYKNIVDRTYLIKTELMGKVFLIQDSLTTLAWEMGSETKQIGKYTAFKATAKKLIKRSNMEAIFRNRRGRQQNDESESETKREEEFEEKIIEIVAWYTPEVSVNNGPGEYWGLPGLILELHDDRTTIICSKIILNPKDEVVIRVPTKGKKVSQVQYDKIAKKKTKEMRENFRNNRNRGGGRPF